MFGKLLKKAKGFGHKREEEVVEGQKPPAEEKPAEAAGSNKEDCPVCKAGEACSHDAPLDAKGEDKAEEKEPSIIDIPPDDRDNKVLARNGYDRIRETAPRKFVIQMSFPAPSLDNPKRMARKTAELYGFSALHAINMIGWKPKKCVVVNEGPRAAADASKPAEGTPEQKPAEGQAVGEVAVLVNGVPRGSLSAPSDMRWKNVIAEAKKLPDVAKALEGCEVIDSIGSSEGSKRTLRLVSRELPKKQEKAGKPEEAAEEAKPEGAAPAVLAEPTVPETVAEAEAEAPKAAEAVAEPVKTTRKDRRAPKRAAAEATKIAKAEADAAAAKAEEEAKAKAAEEAAAKAKEEAEAKAKEEARAKAEAEAAEAAAKAVADANPPEQAAPVEAPVAVPVAEPVFEVAVDLAAPGATDKSAVQEVTVESVAGGSGDGSGCTGTGNGGTGSQGNASGQ